MTEQMNSLYSLLLLVAAVISFWVTMVAWRRRQIAASALPMALFGFAMTWWCLTYAFHWSNLNRPSEYFWLDLTYVGAVIVPGAFFAFALCATHRCHLLTRRVVLLMCIEPVLTLLFLWTDERFGIFFAGRRPEGASAILIGGFGYWFNILYSYLLIFIGFVIVIRTFLRVPRKQRGQTGLILIGATIPWLTNFLSISGLSPFPNLDLTPMAFVLTGVAFSYSIFRYGFLDIVPIARSALVENMPDGVLVLDRQNRLADINPAAIQFLEIESPVPIGQPVEVVVGHMRDLILRYIDVVDGQDEIMINSPTPQFFDVRINSLTDPEGNFSGRLISFRNITERKESELELRRASQRLELQLAEIEALQTQLREQAIRDPLTGLYNRRYLQEALERELLRAKRDEAPLSLVLMDIDRFKNCNDTYGHKAGDLVLQALAEMLVETTRKEDIICRYGGEEFLVVLPGTLADIAHQRTEQWRQKFQELCISLEELQIQTTLSAGIACHPFDGDTMEKLLKVADDALYRAKQSGRNRVIW